MMRAVLLLVAAAVVCPAQEADTIVKSRAVDWPQATPQAVGLDPAGLERAAEYLLSKKPAAASLLIVRQGKLVFERYWGGATREDAGNVKSISKSVLSALAGIALDEHRIGSLDDPVSKYVPEAFAPGADPRSRQIRIRHLLTMTAGLRWAENTDITREWFSSPDPNRFAISLPMVAAPGERFEYSTALTHLLSTVLTRVSKQSTLDYARGRLFKPLGIDCRRWDRLAGIHFGGAELYLTARDLARFGQLYLQKGHWGDRQVVPETWVAESTTPKAEPYYGYLWWLNSPKGHRMVCAQGVWGQYVCVLPDLDMVVAHTSRPASGRIAEAVGLDMIPRHLFAAVRP